MVSFLLWREDEEFVTAKKFNQGCIELPKVVTVHATYMDGKMLNVTKDRFQMYF